VGEAVVPEHLRHLFWEVDPNEIDLVRHADYVMERVMTRGGWEAMRWLRTSYSSKEIAGFLRRRGERITPRDRAYWSLVSGLQDNQRAGGGRPAWAG